MTTAADVTRLRERNGNVVTLARRALYAFWATLDLSKPEAARDALLEFVPQLVAAYGDIAATVAADWYEQMRAAAGIASTFSTALTEGATVEQVQRNVRFSAGHLFTDEPMLMLSALSGQIQRHVSDAGRYTIRDNVARDPSRPRYARVPTGAKTCAWCSLLASRGFAYASASSAGEGNKYHADCDCVAVASWDPHPALENYNPGELYDLYKAARASSGATDSAGIAAEMRRMFPERFTDGVTSGT